MADLTSILGGVTSGGLLGLGGSVVTQVLTWRQKKQEAKDALDRATLDYAHEKDMASINGAAASQAANQSFLFGQMQAQFAAMQASIADQTQLSGHVSQWVADVLALVRPGLTLLLVLAALVMAVAAAAQIAPSALAPFHEFASMASMAVAWWFGDRAVTKARAQ